MTALSDLQDLKNPYYQFLMCEVVNTDEFENTGNGPSVPSGLNWKIGGDYGQNTVCSSFGGCTSYASINGQGEGINHFNLESTDTAPQYFPGIFDWDLEMYVRFPDIPTSGEQVISSDDQYWEIKAAFTETDITITCTMEAVGFGGPIGISGTVLNDGCWHQIWWSYVPYDVGSAVLWLDGEDTEQNTFSEYENDVFSGTFPASILFGGLTGIQTTVEFTHIAFYYFTFFSDQPITSAAEHWATFVGCCGEAGITPPLRMRQRDDTFNTPRTKGRGQGSSSLQHSLRASRGSNTYLSKKSGCGCKPKIPAV